MNEVWKHVPDFEGYQVSNFGRVRSLGRLSQDGKQLRLRILRPSPKPNGYMRVTLTKLDGSYSQPYVHRLVLKAFIGEPEPHQVCCHGDGDRSNNNLNNLRWGTESENQLDRVKHGTDIRGDKHPNRKLSSSQVLRICHLLDSTSLTKVQIADLFNVTRTTIRGIGNGKSWSHLTGRGMSQCTQ